MQHNLETMCGDCKYSCFCSSWWYCSQHHLQRSQAQNIKQFREGELVKHVSTCWRITYIIFISFNMQCTELIVICWFNLGASNVDLFGDKKTVSTWSHSRLSNGRQKSTHSTIIVMFVMCQLDCRTKCCHHFMDWLVVSNSPCVIYRPQVLLGALLWPMHVNHLTLSPWTGLHC